jgi:hypothetical protein
MVISRKHPEQLLNAYRVWPFQTMVKLTKPLTPPTIFETRYYQSTRTDVQTRPTQLRLQEVSITFKGVGMVK